MTAAARMNGFAGTTAADLVERCTSKTGGRAVQSGRNWKLRCPAHDDSNASLSVAQADDGKLLLRCHAGCAAKDIAEAVGLKLADLFPPRPASAKPAKANGQPASPVTLLRLAEAKKLDPARLRELGVEDLPKGAGVGITYTDPTTGETQVKRRTALSAKEGSRWPAGVALMPYGLDMLGPPLKRAEPLYVVEGESDVWTMDAHRLPAIGIPGASSAGCLDARHAPALNAFPLIYVIEEVGDDGGPDAGGKTFPAAVGARLAEIGVKAPVKVLRLPAKDPSALHIRNPDAFKAELGKAAAGSRDINEPAGAEPNLVCFADVKPERIEHLWPGRLALGKITLGSGDPGLGKSVVSVDLAARITANSPWPDGAPNAGGSVIMLGAEDGAADTVAPRLLAAGADMRRVYSLSMVKPPDGAERSFTLEDLVPLEKAIRRVSDCRLVVIDPVSCYLGKADSHSNAEVRGLLAPLSGLADKYKVAIYIVTHLNKSAGTKAMYRAMGSIAFAAAARASYVFCADKADPKRRLMLCNKINIGAEPKGLAYRLLPETVQGIETVRVAWEKDAVDIRADDALGASERQEDADSAVAEAADWLRTELADRPVAAQEAVKRGRAAGFSERTLERARKSAGVIAKPNGFKGPWCWSLPGVTKETSGVTGFEP